MDKSLFYSPNRLLSYNRILNFVIGARGIGKSYGYKKHVVKRFIKHGEQFIYLRRYKTELKKVKNFFDDISQDFPGVEFRVKGWELYVDGKLAGWAMPLSAWQSEKSNAYPNVVTILYDEFIREKDMSGYLPNEVENLLNLMDTVFRNRENVRCVCMSNSVTVVNPYFVYFKLIPDVNKRFNTYESMVIEIPDSKDFANQRIETKFGKLIDGTSYGEMSLHNEFVNDTNVFIMERTKTSKFSYAIKLGKQTFGVWYDINSQTMFLSKRYDKTAKYQYALKASDMNEQTMLVKNYKTIYPIHKLVQCFKEGRLMFEDLETRENGYEILKLLRI